MKKRIIILTLTIIGFGNLYAQNVTDSLRVDFYNKTINNIELFYEDYEVVESYEVKMMYGENGVVLKLKITNPEKLDRLKNSTNPIIYINYNNHKYVARGLSVLSALWSLEDFSFPIDEKEGKIVFFEDEIINFRGFKEIINQENKK
jgi:hypothetical protein